MVLLMVLTSWPTRPAVSESATPEKEEAGV